MGNQFIQRVLTRQFIGASALGDLLSSVADATPTNNPGSKIFVQDISGNMTGFLYAQLSSATALAAGVPVYWTDVAHTKVSDTVASAITYVASAHSAIQSAAGVAINSTLSATTAPYGWFQIGGYMSTITGIGTVTAGDLLVLSNAGGTAPSNDAWTRVAVGTAVTAAEAVSTLYCVVYAAATTTCKAFIMGTVGLP